MQKEDLIKRIRLVATIATVAFVVLVVTLLIQFGFIAHYHTQLNELENNNSEMQQEIKELQDEITRYENMNGNNQSN